MYIGKYSLTSLLFIIGMLLSCQGTDAQESRIITVEQERINFGDEIIFQVENILDQKIAFITTGCSSEKQEYLPSFVIQKREGQVWKRVGAPVCIAIATPPLIVDPGDTKKIEIPTDLGLELSKIPGDFRYLFDVRLVGANKDKTGKVQLAFGQRVSPAVIIQHE